MKSKEEDVVRPGTEYEKSYFGKYKVGDIVVSASGSSYVGEIIYISKEEDVVRHRCRKTGTEYEKSYFGFQCRYMSVEERLEKDKEFCAENIQLHQQILTMEREHNDAIATSKERRESLTHVAAERDEARRDLGEILAVIHRDGGHYTGEHGISKSVADAHATWAAVVRERDEARVEADSARAIYEMASEVADQRERDAEVRGARWALEIALDPSRWPVSKWTPEEVCRDARGKR